MQLLTRKSLNVSLFSLVKTVVSILHVDLISYQYF